MQTLTFPLEVKALADDGSFEGYGSVFGVKDFGGDIIERGAFRKTLAARGARGVRMLADHDPTKRIGVWTEIAEDDHGLKVAGRLLLEKQIGREAYIDLKEGAVEGLSIGYRTVSAQDDGRRRARVLKEIDLFEVSVVTFPMNEAARVTAVKSWEDLTIREIEEGLVRGTLPPLSSKAAKALLSGGFKSLSSERDAGDGDELAALLRRNVERLASR